MKLTTVRYNLIKKSIIILLKLNKILQKVLAPASVLIGSLIGFNYLKENEKFYSNIVMPCVQKLMDGEQAHVFGKS